MPLSDIRPIMSQADSYRPYNSNSKQTIPNHTKTEANHTIPNQTNNATVCTLPFQTNPYQKKTKPNTRDDTVYEGRCIVYIQATIGE